MKKCTLDKISQAIAWTSLSDGGLVNHPPSALGAWNSQASRSALVKNLTCASSDGALQGRLDAPPCHPSFTQDRVGVF